MALAVSKLVVFFGGGHGVSKCKAEAGHQRVETKLQQLGLGARNTKILPCSYSCCSIVQVCFRYVQILSDLTFEAQR